MNSDPDLRRSNMWERLSLHKLAGWLKKDEVGAPPANGEQESGNEMTQEKLNKRSSRKVVPGLPRPATFKRQGQESDRRDRLVPHRLGYDEHRAISSEQQAQSVDRQIVTQQEQDAKWILNLSMHFKDMPDREKFFVTYAEQPDRLRRVTVSIDYRDVEPESLEADLKSLHYQRDKSACIYESIRDSLPEVQFFETVTNLRLETCEGRLHVHVTEDMNDRDFDIVFGNKATEAISDESTWESRLVDKFLERVRPMDTVFVRSSVPLLTAEDYQATEMAFTILPSSHPEADLFSKDYEPDFKNTDNNPWMKWINFQKIFSDRNGEDATAWIKTKMILSVEKEVYSTSQTVNGIWAHFSQATRGFEDFLGYDSVYSWYFRRAGAKIVNTDGGLMRRIEVTIDGSRGGSCVQANPDKKCKYYIPGFLGGQYVQANPDTGSSHDMISESYAAANNYHIDSSGAGPADLPGGRKAWMLGTVTLPFRFENDTKEYLRRFQVMEGLSYSCILGNGFLKLTKTLTVAKNRLDRIRRVAKRTTSWIPRLHLIGGVHERLQGTLNGHQICALPDTGADVNIIRSDVARRLGLKISSDRSHRKLLELGDGSFVRTQGTAYNAQWSFGPHGSTTPLSCEFQVLDDIPCDIILSNDFLFDNSVFELYEHYLYDASSIEQLETCAQLNCITEVPLPEQELDEMMMDVYLHGNEEDRVAGIPSMELPRVERVRFKLSRQRFSRIFTGNALPTGAGGNTLSPGGTALDPPLSPPSMPPQQPKRRWIVRVVRLVIRRSDHELSISASPSSVS